VFRWYDRKFPGKLVVRAMGTHDLHKERVGIVFRKTDKALRAEIALALRKIQSDPTYDTLLEEWFPKPKP
jgi:ABC-type amino acid transport substrate-binding protein